jgi:hypothetical protein
MSSNDRRSLLARAEAAKSAKDYSEAEILYRQLAVTLGYSLGAEHFEVAVVLHELATLLEETGREEDALPFRERASAIMRKLNPPTGK